MKKNLAAITCLLATGLQAACTNLNITPMDGFVTIPISTDGATCYVPTPDLPDLAKAPANCLAAKGLSGVPLICTDFPSAQTLVDLKGMGWDFTTLCPAGWTVLDSKLQVTNFSGFTGSCIFTTRPLTTIEYQQYNSFTLSVVQTVDLIKQKQSASIYLSFDTDSQQISSITGTNPRQRNMYEVAKAALPNGGNNTYQPLFKVSSTTISGSTYQIESIAVMGNP